MSNTITYKCTECGEEATYSPKYYFANRDNLTDSETLYCHKTEHYEVYKRIY